MIGLITVILKVSTRYVTTR